jgi:CxxC motif-containing protein
MRTQSDKARFLENVEFSPNGCWLWKLSLNRLGYGSFWLDGNTIRAYRAAYILFVGPVPARKHVHHLPGCGSKDCVNPAHLTILTAAEHAKEHGLGCGDQNANAKKTHCPRGHEYTPENTYIGKSGSRFCRACGNLSVAAAYRKRKEANPGPGAGSQWSSKTHCPRGHEYSGENLRIRKDGARVCITCRREQGRQQEARRRARRRQEKDNDGTH